MRKKTDEEEQTSRICGDCGKTIEKNDVWYPFFEISSCGGGILHLHAKCAVQRIFSRTKKEMLQRVAEAEEEKDEPLSGGLMNIYSFFPISPIHWVKFYASEDEEKEIVRLVEENKKQNKGNAVKNSKTKGGK